MILALLAESEETPEDAEEGAAGADTGVDDAAQPEDPGAITGNATGSDATPAADTPAPSTPPRTTTSTPHQPREGTKQSKVLEMLRQPDGATVAQIAEAMQWAPHTVRGFFAGLKKRQGIIVVPSERVRQAGPEGAKGSFTIYRIAEAG